MKALNGKNMQKIMGLLLGVICFWMLMKTELMAAGTVSVTADKTAAAVGETITVSVQTSVPEDPATVPEIAVTYNPDVLTFTGCNVEYGGGGGGLITFYGQSATITFTAAQTGEAGVGVEAIIDDDGNNPATGSCAISVGGGAQGEASSDATLYALEMNPGQMVPEFSPEVTEYKILIDHDVTDITVSGAVSDENAQITAASGFKNLKEGTNDAIITVTAADGTTLSYHFTIERSEAGGDAESEEEADAEEEENNQISNGLEVVIDDVTYTVQTAIAEEILPEGCVKTSSSFNGEAVEAALFEKGGLTLLYALSESGSGEFFIYNESTGKLQLFLQIRSIENRYIIPIEAKEGTPATFKESKMQWNNSYIPAFVLADTSIEHGNEFYLLYAVNNEGERAFYMYDTMEGTYQRFLNYTGADTVSADTGDHKPLMIAVIVLAVLLVGALLLIVNMIISNKEMQEEARYAGKTKKNPKRKPVKKQPVREQRPKPEKRRAPEEETDKEEKVAEVKTVTPQPAVRKTVTPQPEQKAAVTSDAKHVTGAVGITGNIPIKVVQPPKSEVKRPQVPIYTLERPPVQLTREAPPDQLDDDFEFEFISMDNE